MYQDHEQLSYNSQFGQGDYLNLTPLPSETGSYPYLEYNERQIFPFFPSQGGPMGPPPVSPPPFQPQGQSQAGPPTTPPPSYVPTQTQQAEALAVDPGSIRRCLFRYTYVWLRGFQQFWFYPTFVGRRSVSGYRWNGFRWIYFGISLRQIQSFTCL